MTDKHGPTHFLAADEIRILKFVIRRQLSRWANKRNPTPEQRAQRATLQQILHVLNDDAFVDGCDLHVPSEK
jgi:hypothetical protein